MEQIMLFFTTYHPVRHLLLAVLILVLGNWLVKFVTRWIERTMIRAQIEPTVTRFILHISHFILMLVLVGGNMCPVRPGIFARKSGDSRADN